MSSPKNPQSKRPVKAKRKIVSKQPKKGNFPNPDQFHLVFVSSHFICSFLSVAIRERVVIGPHGLLQAAKSLGIRLFLPAMLRQLEDLHSHRRMLSSLLLCALLLGRNES